MNPFNTNNTSAGPTSGQMGGLTGDEAEAVAETAATLLQSLLMLMVRVVPQLPMHKGLLA